MTQCTTTCPAEGKPHLAAPPAVEPDYALNVTLEDLGTELVWVSPDLRHAFVNNRKDPALQVAAIHTLEAVLRALGGGC